MSRDVIERKASLHNVDYFRSLLIRGELDSLATEETLDLLRHIKSCLASLSPLFCGALPWYDARVTVPANRCKTMYLFAWYEDVYPECELVLYFGQEEMAWLDKLLQSCKRVWWLPVPVLPTEEGDE